jgi:hypothetical protein
LLGVGWVLRLGSLKAQMAKRQRRDVCSFAFLGRVTSNDQTTDGTTYSFSYNFADGLTQMKYPSENASAGTGTVVSYGYL